MIYPNSRKVNCDFMTIYTNRPANTWAVPRIQAFTPPKGFNAQKIWVSTRKSSA